MFYVVRKEFFFFLVDNEEEGERNISYSALCTEKNRPESCKGTLQSQLAEKLSDFCKTQLEEFFTILSALLFLFWLIRDC